MRVYFDENGTLRDPGNVGAFLDIEGQVRDRHGNPIVGVRRQGAADTFVPFSGGLTFAAQAARGPVFATGSPDGAVAAFVQRVPAWAWIALGVLVVVR